MKSEWPLWEIFIRSQHGLAHRHVGSLHAADAEMAIKNARDVYTRRNEGVSIWAVRSADVVASAPGDKEPLFEPAYSKVYVFLESRAVPDPRAELLREDQWRVAESQQVLKQRRVPRHRLALRHAHRCFTSSGIGKNVGCR